MATPKSKTPLQSSNFWVGISTVIGILLAYFHIVPDAKLVQEGADAAVQVANAVEAKNWLTILGLLAGGNLINIVTKITKYFKSA